jgi:flagellar motor switch protein FliG
MNKIVLLMMALFFSQSVFGSVVPEIEDYYTKKASEYVQTRFPQRPYTVFVKVDTGDTQNVKRGELADRKAKNLPYLDVVDENNDFWSRTDLPLASFLPFLKTVYVKLELDANLTPQEFESFKQDMFLHLKLSAAADRIEVSQMTWTPQNEFLPRQYMVGLAVGIPVLLFLIFFGVTRMGVRSLVRGLAEPLKNISKSTEAFAGQSAVMNQGKKSFESDFSRKDFIGSENEIEKITELLEKTKPFFADLDGKTLGFVEKWGAESPEAMGAILAEMSAEQVKELFRWGVGDWWTQALTQAGSWDSKMLYILIEAHHEWRRQELLSLKSVVSADEKLLSLSLARLTPKEIGIVLKGKTLETIEPVLALLPQDVMINVCKYMFPGEWGKIIDKKRQVQSSISDSLRKEIYKKAVDIKTLREEKDVSLIYLEADLIKYLNAAVTKDEREVYRTLPVDSNIIKNRFPFYKVFESSQEQLKKLVADVSLEDWAFAMTDCDRDEADKILQLFTDRQKFMLRTMNVEMQNHPQKNERKAAAKRFIALQAIKASATSNVLKDSDQSGASSVAA